MKLKIDNEFKSLIPPLTTEEYNQLEENIIEDGCLHSIIIWDNTIIDGHNRYQICTENNIPFSTRPMIFDSKEDAIDWIIKHQLGRRNLTEFQISKLRGEQYLNEKKRKEDSLKQNLPKDHFDPTGRISEKLGSEHGVSCPTIRRDADFAKALKTIKSNIGEEAEQKILTKDIKTTKADVLRLASLPVEDQKKIFNNDPKVIKLNVSGEEVKAFNHKPKEPVKCPTCSTFKTNFKTKDMCTDCYSYIESEKLKGNIIDAKALKNIDIDFDAMLSDLKSVKLVKVEADDDIPECIRMFKELIIILDTFLVNLNNYANQQLSEDTKERLILLIEECKDFKKLLEELTNEK